MDEIPKLDSKLPEVDFLRAELSTGFILSRIALDATNERKKARNRANARKAYDAVLRFLPSTDLGSHESAEIKSKLELLRSDLRLLGEKI